MTGYQIDGANAVTHLRSADWVVQSIDTHAAAVDFIRRNHYAKGASNTSTFRHGLYRSNTAPLVGDLFGVALWIPPTRTAGESVAGDGWSGVLALSRLVIDPTVPTNGASFLLGRSMRLIDRARWHTLLTYADTSEGHTGAIYKATNWACIGPTAAGDTWVDVKGMQRGRKRGGRTLTASEMTDAGFTRKPSMPKIKFVHKVAA